MLFTTCLTSGCYGRFSVRGARRSARRGVIPASDGLLSIERLEYRIALSAGAFTTGLGFGGSSVGDNGIAMQADGKTVVADFAHEGDRYGFWVARYNADGSFDTTFGDGGTLTTEVVDGVNGASAVAVQPDGKIVVAGYAAGAIFTEFAVVRYESDGTLDATFGDGGVVMTFVGAWGSASSLALQADGRIVVAGSAESRIDGDFVLVRYNNDGSLDASWGDEGVVVTDFGESWDHPSRVAWRADGRIVAVGTADNYNDTGWDYAVARYNSDGSLDASFGDNGQSIVSTESGTNPAELVTRALEYDSRLSPAGQVIALSSSSPAIVAGQTANQGAVVQTLAAVNTVAAGTWPALGTAGSNGFSGSDADESTGIATHVGTQAASKSDALVDLFWQDLAAQLAGGVFAGV